MTDTAPAIIEMVSADALACIVRDAGIKALVETDADGATVIRSASSGWTTTIRLLNPIGDAYASLQFILWLGDKDRSVSLAKMNDFNAHWRFANGWLNTEQPGLCLEMDVALEGGVTASYLAKRVVAWDLLVAAFRAYMVEAK